jgi:hypothetical protein
MYADCYATSTDPKTFLAFRAKIRLSDLKITLPKTSLAFFEASFGDTMVTSKAVRVGKTPSDELERLELPVRICFDRRQQRFFGDKLVVGVFIHNATYSKKVGYIQISLSELLNDQRKSLAKVFRLERCSDRLATVKIALGLELLGVSKGGRDALDQSGFSYESRTENCIKSPIIDSTKFDFLRRMSRCKLNSSVAQEEGSQPRKVPFNQLDCKTDRRRRSPGLAQVFNVQSRTVGQVRGTQSGQVHMESRQATEGGQESPGVKAPSPGPQSPPVLAIQIQTL